MESVERELSVSSKFLLLLSLLLFGLASKAVDDEDEDLRNFPRTYRATRARFEWANDSRLLPSSSSLCRRAYRAETKESSSSFLLLPTETDNDNGLRNCPVRVVENA